MLLAAIALTVFGSTLDNGFISDDFVLLDRAEALPGNPLHLFSMPPESSRTWTYLFFLGLQRLVGYTPFFFYLVGLLIHALNALLLGRLLLILGIDPRSALFASIFFAAFERPHEAVFWLSGSNETFLGTTILLFLISWFSGRRWLAVFCYLSALLAKESAPIALVFLALGAGVRGKTLHWRKENLALAGLTVAHALWLLYSLQSNSLVAGGFYSLDPWAAVVLMRSTLRLTFPWLYLIAVALWLARRSPPAAVGWWLGWLVVAQLPYIFLTYLDHLPSRHQYLASIGLAATLGILLNSLDHRRLRLGLLAGFVLFNAGYLWLRKDAEFESRAAPTRALIEFQRDHPGELEIEGFPLNSSIARLTSRVVPGNTPSMILTVELGESCRNCPRLVWHKETESYHVR